MTYVKIIVFVISLALFIFGFWVMGSSFYVTGFEGLVFFSGIICSSLGLAIPVHLLKRIDA